jgi:SAM-dependent methyltransferase
MIRLPFNADNLVQGENGCWFSLTQGQVSYPDVGSEACFAIEDSSFWFRHRNECIAEIIRSSPPRGPILDVGGGNGYVAAGLVAKGMEVVVLEPGRTGAMNAKSRGVRHVICSTLENAGLVPGSISAIGLFDVLEHIEQDVAFLRTLESLLLPRGQLYVTVPAYKWLWSAEDESAEHYRRYTLGTLAAKLEQAGFGIDFRSYMFAFLPIPVFLCRTLPSKLGLRRGLELQRMKKEHAPSAGWGSPALEILMKAELAQIRKGRVIPFGSSCIVTARKLES